MNYSISDFLKSEKFTIIVDSNVYKFEHSYYMDDMIHTLKFTGGVFKKEVFMISDNHKILSIFCDLVNNRKFAIDKVQFSEYAVNVDSFLKESRNVSNF